MCSGCRKGRGEGGHSLRRYSWELRAGGLQKSMALASCTRQLQSHLRPDPVQTSADKFGTPVVEVTPMTDIVVKRKELD